MVSLSWHPKAGWPDRSSDRLLSAEAVPGPSSSSPLSYIINRRLLMKDYYTIRFFFSGQECEFRHRIICLLSPNEICPGQFEYLLVRSEMQEGWDQFSFTPKASNHQAQVSYLPAHCHKHVFFCVNRTNDTFLCVSLWDKPPSKSIRKACHCGAAW